MSNCRDSYCNYGSYLRSRGYDKQICNLVNEIENGNINNGAVNPNSNGNGAVVNGSLIVKSLGQANPSVSNTRMQEGLIYSVGGQLGSSGEFIENDDLGMQIYKGTRINGPIIQTGNNSHVKANAAGSSVVNHVNTNIFKADTHIFTNDSSDCQVLIKGNLVFDGSLVQLPDTIETSLTLEAPATHDKEMLTIFHGATEAPGLDIVDVWIDGSFNIPPRTWDERLAFAIDGDLSSNQTIGDNGGTAVHGHTRILRGATVLNRCDDGAFNKIDISYSVNDASLSDVALDVYGKIKVHEGPTYDGANKADANIELYSNSLATPTITLQGDSGDIDFKHGFAEQLTLEGVPNGPGILAGGNPEGLIIRDVSNIRFLDNSEIFAGNSLDISSDKVEFLHGDVHVAENLSVSGNVISTGKIVQSADSSITNELNHLDIGTTSSGQAITTSGKITCSALDAPLITGTLQTVAQPNITSVGTLTSVDIDGGAIDGTIIGANSASTGAFTTLSASTIIGTPTINNAILFNPTVSGILTGDVTGNAGTATALQNARNIGGVSFDGTADIDLPGVNTAGNQNTSGQAGSVVNGVYTTSSVTDLHDVTSVGSGAIITALERTKLSGIEASADVTDSTNVEAAGAVMTSGNQTIAGNKTFSDNIVANNIEATTEYTGHTIEVNTAKFTNDLTIGDGSEQCFSVNKPDIASNPSGEVIIGAKSSTASNFSDLVFPGTTTGNNVLVTNTNGQGVLEIAGSLRPTNFSIGTGITPVTTQSQGGLTGTDINKRNTNTFGGGDGSTIHEDSKFRGGTIAVAGASEYTIGQIVLALKNFGILEQ